MGSKWAIDRSRRAIDLALSVAKLKADCTRLHACCTIDVVTFVIIYIGNLKPAMKFYLEKNKFSRYKPTISPHLTFLWLNQHYIYLTKFVKR